MEKYNTVYRLKKDIPQSKAGRLLRHDVRDGEIKYHFVREYCEEDIKWNNSQDYGYEPFGDIRFSLEEIKNEDFFEPIGDWKSLYPKFPSEKEIDEFLYLIGDTRLVDSVDFIRAVNPILESKEYRTEVYNLLKNKYNKKYAPKK